MPVDSRQELVDELSPQEERAGFSLKATRIFMADWADRHYIRGIMLDSNQGNGERYPYGSIPAFCKRVVILAQGRGVDNAGLCQYEKCKITGFYETPNPTKGCADPSKPEEQIAETLEPTIEFITLDPAQFRWKTLINANPTGKLFKEAAPGIQMHGFNYTYVRQNITTIHSDVHELVGCINAQPVTMRLYPLTFPAQRMLYLPPQLGFSFLSDGSLKYKVEMKFTVRNVPTWNKFFRPELYVPSNFDAAFDNIVRKDNGVPIEPYPVKSFANLFPA